MATRRIKSLRGLKYSEGFTAGLSSAILEWLLILLLFVNALFSYLVTRFARFYKLKIPCLLCSRLDHVFGNEKPGFYRDLICSAHKLEISSLVFCHVHDKLADVHGMCEGCLVSFATEKRSNSETYRLLVGKLGTDHEFFVDKKPLFKNPVLEPSSERHCTCCNKLWKTTPYMHKLLQKKLSGLEVAKFDINFPGSGGHSGSKLFDGLKKRRANMGGRGFDPLCHVGYSELKLTSDSESEVPFSDDDDARSLVLETSNHKEEFVARCPQPETRTIVSDTTLNAPHDVSEPIKSSEEASTPIPSLLVPHERHDVGELYHMTSSTSRIAVGHGLEELNWQHFEQRLHPPALLDLISLHDVPSQSNIAESIVEISRGKLDVMGIGDIVGKSKKEIEGVCRLATGLTLEIVQCSKRDQAAEVSGETFDTSHIVEDGQISSTESGDASQSDTALTIFTGPGSKRDQVSNNLGQSLISLVDLGDTYKMAVGNKGGQVSSLFTEQHAVKDSAKVNEDLKLLLTHTSANRGSEQTVNDTSPRLRGLCEELKIPRGSSSIGLDTLQKRISIERNESGFESLDGNSVNEIEGESLVDHMKRQIEYDRKCMSDLYKELDEERSASAVAANQAMAMITRLQEEKAALHMEALQYLRMMEEQAEYDVEALQKANDLLAEREKDIQDLEADLDYYRIKYPEAMEDAMPDSCDYKEVNLRVENSDSSGVEIKANGNHELQSSEKSEDSSRPEKTGAVSNHVNTNKGSSLNLEDERLYILQCLKKLENKLTPFSDNGVHIEMCNGIYSGKDECGLADIEQDHFNEAIHEKNQMEEDKLSVQRDSYQYRRGSPSQEGSIPSLEDLQSVGQGNHYFDPTDGCITSTTNDLVSIGSEILDLNERLESLEADKDFLEHTINSLQSGYRGVEFIQEIAHHLRELRRIGIRRKEKDVA